MPMLISATHRPKIVLTIQYRRTRHEKSSSAAARLGLTTASLLRGSVVSVMSTATKATNRNSEPTKVAQNCTELIAPVT